MADRPRAGAPTFVLLVVVLCALAVGAAASAIAGAVPASSGPNGPLSQLSLSGAVVTYTLLGAFGALLAFLLYRRLTSATVPVPSRVVVTLLVVLLLASVCVLLGHLVVSSGAATGASNSGAGTSGNNTTHSGSGTNMTVNATGTAPTFHLTPPPWILYLVVIGIAVGIAVVAVPQTREVLTGWWHRGRHRPLPGAAARGALERAVHGVEAGEDPRSVIIGLYAELLRQLGRMVGDLDPVTPEEIRVRHLVRLGIRPETAEALTRLFEEAKYSSHPMDALAAGRAVDVMRAAGADLDRSAGAA
jgi:hypothetical protein